MDCPLIGGSFNKQEITINGMFPPHIFMDDDIKKEKYIRRDLKYEKNYLRIVYVHESITDEDILIIFKEPVTIR